MLRTQISLTEAQAELLRRLAAERNQSQASILREALESILDEADGRRRVRAARSVVGGFRSGRRDTAERHDEALDEAFGS